MKFLPKTEKNSFIKTKTVPSISKKIKIKKVHETFYKKDFVMKIKQKKKCYYIQNNNFFIWIIINLIWIKNRNFCRLQVKKVFFFLFK